MATAVLTMVTFILATIAVAVTILLQMAEGEDGGEGGEEDGEEDGDRAPCNRQSAAGLVGEEGEGEGEGEDQMPNEVQPMLSSSILV